VKKRSGIPRRPPREWPQHIAYIHALPCCIAHRNGHVCHGDVIAAHVRTGTDGGTGIKPSDFWTIPLCDGAHRSQHQMGEPEFERRYHFSMKKFALAFALLSPDAAMRAAMIEMGIG
jgi:hypothetical protein